MTKDDVFAAFAPPAPGEIQYSDFIDADPPPRELGPAARRYVRTSSTYFWLGLMIFFLVLPSVIAAAVIPRADTIGWAVAILALAVWLARGTAAKRRGLRKIAIEGRQVPARVRTVFELRVRGGARGVTLGLDVEGKQVSLRSWSGDLEGLSRGACIRVLVHDQVPGIVVPVVAVT